MRNYNILYMVYASKSYVPFKSKFPMVMHFELVPNNCCRSKNNFDVSNYDETSLKFSKIFSFLLQVFTEHF